MKKKKKEKKTVPKKMGPRGFKKMKDWGVVLV